MGTILWKSAAWCVRLAHKWKWWSDIQISPVAVSTAQHSTAHWLHFLSGNRGNVDLLPLWLQLTQASLLAPTLSVNTGKLANVLQDKAECVLSLSCFCISLVKILPFFFFSGFQISTLAVSPHHNEPQQPPDGLHQHNTLALQRTGACMCDTFVCIFFNVFMYLWLAPFWTLCVYSCFILCVFYDSSTEDTCIELTRAIEAGDMKSASAFAATLALQRAALKIQPSTRDHEYTEVK